MAPANELDRTVRELRNSINIRHEHIRYMQNHFGNDPEMRQSILSDIRIVESLQHKADFLSKFNELQMDAL